ncbi:unnamed protein product [Triticum turgidum subsp. durum]|uniref:Dehydrin n=1 Tax=Triticum turgidum subsp. durum TaxID=4567 RepID=A0A9R0YRR8_TRITD|nr:unnamed protein product [Triticum turgidum subsp. durum]
MEDERSTQSYQGGEAAEQVEVTDRGLLGNLLGKKKAEEDKEKQEELVTGMEKVSVEEPEVKKEEHEDGEKKETLFSKLHRSSSSSSSSSDEEEEEVIDDNGEVIKRKKKKGLKEKLKEKLPGHKDTEGEHVTGLPAPAAPASVQTHHDTDVVVEKIDGDVKTEAPAAEEVSSPDAKEKKGLLGKIMDKLPGYHKTGEEDKAAAAAGEHKPSA